MGGQRLRLRLARAHSPSHCPAHPGRPLSARSALLANSRNSVQRAAQAGTDARAPRQRRQSFSKGPRRRRRQRGQLSPRNTAAAKSARHAGPGLYNGRRARESNPRRRLVRPAAHPVFESTHPVRSRKSAHRARPARLPDPHRRAAHRQSLRVAAWRAAREIPALRHPHPERVIRSKGENIECCS